jgi:hypothetical protein
MICVFKEQFLEPPVAGEIDLRIIWGIQVEKRKAFDLCVRVERVALNHANPSSPGLIGPSSSIEFDGISFNLCACRDQVESCSGANARIDDRGLIRVIEELANLSSFRLR